MAYIFDDNEPQSACCGANITSLQLCGDCSEPTGPAEFDADEVNSLLQKEEKVSVASIAACLILAALVGAMMTLSFAGPAKFGTADVVEVTGR
jgi:hypothetical protein